MSSNRSNKKKSSSKAKSKSKTTQRPQPVSTPIISPSIPETFVCSYCSNAVLKSAYQFSCQHVICIFCMSRGALLSSLSPLSNLDSSSPSSNLSIIKLSCNKCTNGSAEIKISDFINLVLIPTECLQHGPSSSCPKCKIWETQMETITKCSFHHNIPSIAYCKSCKSSICNECIASNAHSKHKVKELVQYQRSIESFAGKMKLSSYDKFSSWLFEKHVQFNEDYQSELKTTMSKIDILIEALNSLKNEYLSRMQEHMKKANDVFDIIYFMYYIYYKQMESRSNNINRLLFLNKMKQQIESINLVSTKGHKDIDKALVCIENFNQRNPYTFDIKINFTNALQQSSFTLYGHQGYVFNLISLDKECIASCSEDNDIRIWNVKTKECVKTISKAHSSSIFSLCKLKHKKFASGSFGEIKLWNRKTFNEEDLLTGHTDYVVKLQYIKKPNSLASSSYDKTIRIWDIQSKRCLQILIGHSGYVNSFSTIKDVNQGDLASVSYDKTLRVWCAKDSQCLYDIEAHDGPIYSILQLKNRTVLTGSYSEMKIWDLNKKECLRCIIERNTGVYDLLKFRNGKVASCSFQSINIWDLNKEDEPWITSLNEHSHFVTSLILFKKKTLVSASDDKTIKIWD